MKPVRIFKSDDFPAPEGPKIAVNSPDLKRPDTPFRTVFFSVIIKINKHKLIDGVINDYAPVVTFQG